MKEGLLALGACASAALVVGAIALCSACEPTAAENVLTDIPFDGGALGPCTDGATMLISAAECPGSCSGSQATAICVGTSYAECSCLPSTATFCDSGCCAAPGYEVMYCKGQGKVAIPDPSEGLCPTATGYLLCNDLCYASFSCALPPGYTLAGHDAGRDAAADAPHKDSGKPEAGHDGGGDASPEASPEGGDGSATDAPASDAPAG